MSGVTGFSIAEQREQFMVSLDTANDLSASLP
jgi:hypothetical protein